MIFIIDWIGPKRMAQGPGAEKHTGGEGDEEIADDVLVN